ncbi:MAG: hypothetical protein ACI85Q_002101 [Salibacteraceae bacterium]|jgi:hypothetical protein
MILGFGFLLSCSSSNKARNQSTSELDQDVLRPSWVNNRPIDQAYYTGISVASKTATPTTYATAAQGNALNELASSIEVQVKSNSMLFSFEEQNTYKDEFKEFIQVKTNQSIENYELVATWENATEYWVYYRLSKAQFQADKQARISKATDLSVGVLIQAEEEWSRQNYRMAMIHFFDALKPIKPYLGESLEVTLNGSKDVFLGNYLLTQISQGTRAFTLVGNQSQIEAKWGGPITSEELTFLVKSPKNKPLAQIPVKFTYSEGMIRPRDGVSSSSGKVFTEIKKLGNSNNIQEVRAEIDFQGMILGNVRPDEIDKLIFDRISNVSSSIKIKVVAPKLYAQSKELSSVKKTRTILKKAFELEANQMGFITGGSKKYADLLVDIQASSHNVGESYGLKNVYLNATIKVIEQKTKLVVYQEEISKLKGVGSSYEEAANQAYQKAKEHITKKIVPRFYRKYTN